MAIVSFEYVYITDSGDGSIPDGFYIVGPENTNTPTPYRYVFQQGFVIGTQYPRSCPLVHMTGSDPPTLLNSLGGPTMAPGVGFGAGAGGQAPLHYGASVRRETGEDLSMLAFGLVLGITQND